MKFQILNRGNRGRREEHDVRHRHQPRRLREGGRVTVSLRRHCRAAIPARQPADRIARRDLGALTAATRVAGTEHRHDEPEMRRLRCSVPLRWKLPRGKFPDDKDVAES